ncbi:MAG: protein translocase subunit SecD [Gammaproteobacteria bacterium]|jgi:preprotein translocase subunit SecD|nr:protein translocase subunit SecD [Gammaproteobacteria bacterium]MBT7602916.1 protein translocase subunit SecD [Gammaproteobacteria bacterium]
MKILSFKQLSVLFVLVFSIIYSLPNFFGNNIPPWLSSINANQMNLGLDLKGGVHFLMEVNLNEVVENKSIKLSNDIRAQFRSEEIRYKNYNHDRLNIYVEFINNASYKEAEDLINNNYQNTFDIKKVGDNKMSITISNFTINELRIAAIKQNTTTLRNRVNELGVAEPIVQQSGKTRIVVELPGVKDTTRAKEIIGATATLEFKMVDEDSDPYAAQDSDNTSLYSKLYYDDTGQPVLLKRNVILRGENIVDASSGFDRNSRPSVNITLDGPGAKRFAETTDKNIGKLMAVLFIENKAEQRTINGNTKRVTKKYEKIISIATIQERLSKTFQITGLDSPKQARDLALYLRAGSMAAPMYIVEERTIGPSLGADNIEKGKISVIIGLILVLIFMVFYYRVFGLFANFAVILNILVIVSVMSLIPGATLTLPGIAGIVLTVGMAVDANVLIFERIKEEISNGSTLLASIELGYKKAFSTIADANITTLIASIVLFIFGTGPIKGFAVTLSIGVISSMFTAIIVTRVLANFVYERNINLKAKKLHI